MKRSTLFLLSPLLLISLAGCQPYEEPRENDDPLFFFLKRLEVAEKIRDRIYPDARQAILSAGWTPLQDSTEDDARLNSEAANEFLKKGYVEIDDCGGNQPTFCHFVFKDSLGNKLLVTTAGDEKQPLPAIVTYTQVLSDYKPSEDG